MCAWWLLGPVPRASPVLMTLSVSGCEARLCGPEFLLVPSDPVLTFSAHTHREKARMQPATKPETIAGFTWQEAGLCFLFH